MKGQMLNSMEKSYIDYIIKGENSIIKKWIDFGSSGWRLNVIDELPDEFIELIRKRMQEINKDNVLVR